MKKLLSVLAVLFVMGTTSVFAKGSTGIGAQVGYPLGGALTFKVSSAPCVFALDFSPVGGFGVGLTADWWVKSGKISGPFGWYVGPGLYAGLGLGGEYFAATVGARALAGLDCRILDNTLEFYLQAGWEPTLTISNGGIDPSFAGFFGNLGFRFWF